MTTPITDYGQDVSQKYLLEFSEIHNEAWGFPQGHHVRQATSGILKRMRGTRILVVDDHPFGLTTLAAALSGRGFHVQSSLTAREALEVSPTFLPDVALLDLDLGPGPTGIDLAYALRRLHPSIGVCILTSYRDPRLAGTDIPALPIGSLYLCKADVAHMQLLVDAVTLLSHAPLTRRKAYQSTGPTENLTDIQMEVLLLVGEGVTTAEIAARRGVTQGAIEQTIARICERLDIPKDARLNQRVQLVQALNRLRGQVSVE